MSWILAFFGVLVVCRPRTRYAAQVAESKPETLKPHPVRKWDLSLRGEGVFGSPLTPDMVV
jgi:hypothetical protein